MTSAKTSTDETAPEPRRARRGAALVEAGRSLSFTTRALLLAYALYVPGAWLWGVAPGEIALPHAEVEPLDGTLASAVAVHRATDTLLVMELGVDGLVIVDTSRLHDGDDLDTAIVARGPAPGRVYSATRRDDGLHLLTEADDGTRSLLRIPLDGSEPVVTEADPRALWPLPDGTAMGHGLTDFLVHDAWDKHPSGRPAPVSGSLVLVRMAWELPEPEGLWAELPRSLPDDLMILDADNAEPRGWIDTYRLDQISPAPAIPGFLVVAVGFPELALCDEQGCRMESIDIRADSHPIEQLDHSATAERIAACTPTELYLYEGDPRQRAVVYLGRAPLPAPCTSLAIIDQTRVLVTGEQGPRLVRFGGDDDG